MIKEVIRIIYDSPLEFTKITKITFYALVKDVIKKFFPPKKKTEYDDIEKKESKVLPTIIFLLIVICPILLWLILQFYYAWFLPT